MTGRYITDDDKLAAKQLTAMQRLDDSVRAGLMTTDEAKPIEGMVRAGQVPGALKRISEIRRQRRLAHRRTG